MRTFLIGCLIWLTTALTGEAASLYVDGNLAATCAGTTYSVADRTCIGSSGAGYKTIPEGLRALRASDTLFIRGGTYVYDNIVYGNTSGDTFGCKPTCPISWATATRVTNYPGERVNIKGLFINMDNDDNLTNGWAYFIMEGETRSSFIMEPNGTNCPDPVTCAPGVNQETLRVNNAVHHVRFKTMTIRNSVYLAFNSGNSTQCTRKPSFVEVIDIEFRNNGNSVPNPGAGSEHTIYPTCGDNFLIQGNYVVASHGSGIHINSSNAMDNPNALLNFTVLDNIVEGRNNNEAGTSMCIVITRGSGHVVRNNRCIGRGSQIGQYKVGISIYRDVNAVVENNTVNDVAESCYEIHIEGQNNRCNSSLNPSLNSALAPPRNLRIQ